MPPASLCRIFPFNKTDKQFNVHPIRFEWDFIFLVFFSFLFLFLTILITSIKLTISLMNKVSDGSNPERCRFAQSDSRG